MKSSDGFLEIFNLKVKRDGFEMLRQMGYGGFGPLSKGGKGGPFTTSSQIWGNRFPLTCFPGQFAYLPIEKG